MSDLIDRDDLEMMLNVNVGITDKDTMNWVFEVIAKQPAVDTIPDDQTDKSMGICFVRSEHLGMFVGKIEKQNGREVVLTDCYGIVGNRFDQVDNYRITYKYSRLIMLDALAITPCTEEQWEMIKNLPREDGEREDEKVHAGGI